jgi:hypothetical protein
VYFEGFGRSKMRIPGGIRRPTKQPGKFFHSLGIRIGNSDPDRGDVVDLDRHSTLPVKRKGIDMRELQRLKKLIAEFRDLEDRDVRLCQFEEELSSGKFKETEDDLPEAYLLVEVAVAAFLGARMIGLIE